MPSSIDIEKFRTILGASKTSTKKEITTKYRKLAMKLHPDHNKNTPESTRLFQELNDAHEYLSKEAERQEKERRQCEQEAAAATKNHKTVVGFLEANMFHVVGLQGSLWVFSAVSGSVKDMAIFYFGLFILLLPSPTSWTKVLMDRKQKVTPMYEDFHGPGASFDIVAKTMLLPWAGICAVSWGWGLADRLLQFIAIVLFGCAVMYLPKGFWALVHPSLPNYGFGMEMTAEKVQN